MGRGLFGAWSEEEGPAAAADVEMADAGEQAAAAEPQAAQQEQQEQQQKVSLEDLFRCACMEQWLPLGMLLTD